MTSLEQENSLPEPTIEEIVSETDIKTAAEMLAREFYKPELLEKATASYEEALKSGKSRGVMTRIGNEVAGVATYNVYNWEKLGPQLYFQGDLNASHATRALRLRRISDLVADTYRDSNHTETAVEMSYNVVLPRFRGMKLGSRQWDKRLELIGVQYPEALVFTLARSEFSGLGVDQRILEYLLSVEREAQGIPEGGRVNVEGVFAAIGPLGTTLGLDLTNVSAQAGALQTISLARRSGFKHLGYSRNLSPVWGRFVETRDNYRSDTSLATSTSYSS
jgi:hypothetical protein